MEKGKNDDYAFEKTDKFRELLERSHIKPEEVARINRMNVWQAAKKNDDTGDWDGQDLYGMQITPAMDEDDLRWQAESANIEYTRRERHRKMGEKVIAVFSDLQTGYRRIRDREGNETMLPLHDEAAMRAVRLVIADVMPDLIVNNGDSVDLASLSHFKPDSNHFVGELGPAFQRIHDYYAELRADNPKARIVEVSSNHNQRLDDYVLKNFPQAWDLYRAGDNDEYPVLSYPYLANLKDVNVEWIGGYPAGELTYGEEYGKPPIIFRHGTQTSQNGTTAAKIMKKYPETWNVNGHDHTTGEAWHTLRDGTMLATFVVGCLCKTTGEVSSYGSSVDNHNRPVPHRENWQQSMLLIHDHENGEYDFDQIMIRDGKAYYKGTEYDGNASLKKEADKKEDKNGTNALSTR